MMVETKQLSTFDRYLSVWVGLCILVGIGIGWLFPAFPLALKQAKVAHVSISVAILIWLMIYPMMLQIDFSRVLHSGRRPRGVVLTLIVNWAIKPFTMAGIAALFLFVVFRGLISTDLAREYYAGAILLGAAPCTAMVFVWSYLARGRIIRKRGQDWFEKRFVDRLKPLATDGLLLTLIILFSYQGETIMARPLHILLIAIPLTFQRFSFSRLATVPYISCEFNTQSPRRRG